MREVFIKASDKKRIQEFLFVGLLLLFVLSACEGKNGVRKESELKRDLIEKESLFQMNTEILSFKVVKRQTNRDAMTDIVYVEVESKGQEFECVTSYIMNYSLYDEGWLLEGVERWDNGEWYGRPLTGVSEEMVWNDLVFATANNSYYGFGYDGRFFGSEGFNLETVKEQDTDLENGIATVYYTYSYGDIYGRYLIDGHMDYHFDNRSFCYYMSNITEDMVQYILSDNMLGQVFGLNGDNSITSIGYDMDITFTKSEDRLIATLDIEHMYVLDPESRYRDYYGKCSGQIGDIEIWVDSYDQDDGTVIYYGRCSLTFSLNGRKATLQCQLSPVGGITRVETIYYSS